MTKDIVFISGSLTNSNLWNYQKNHWQSTKHFHDVDILNSSSIVEMAKRFVNIAPDKFILIGFSMGGYIALELFRHIPRKIEKLVLINSGAQLVSEKGKRERERSLKLIDNNKFDFLVNLIFKNSIYDQKIYPQLSSQILKMAHQVGAENYRRQLKAILTKPDHSSLLSSISCPTLLIASLQDKVVPKEHSDYMANCIQHSTLKYLENCGHLATLEQPDKINQVLFNWL